MLEVRNLWFKYPSSKDWVLRGANLSISQGEFVCVGGPSGCGKSTLLLSFNGIVPHGTGGTMKGSVIVDGADTKDHGIYELARVVGLVQQNPDDQFRTLSVEEEVAFGPENCMLPRDEIARRVDWALKLTEAEHLRHRDVDQLSGGEKQRVIMASSLAMKPKVIVLDEPTSNIDMKGSFEIIEALNEIRSKTGLTILVAEHKLDLFLPISDRFVVINNGSILRSGSPASVVAESYEILSKIGLGPPQAFKLLTGDGKISFSSPLKVCDTLSTGPNVTPARSEKPDVVIDVQGLQFRYANGIEALSDLNLTVRRGEFVGIAGTNGSGKTTFLLHLIGILKPQRGRVVVCGMDTSSTPVSGIARKVGFVFQNPSHQLFEESVSNELLFAPRNFGLVSEDTTRAVDDVVNLVDIRGFGERHPHSLSIGQMKRLCVGSILIYDPEVIMLDEPFFGQDYGHANQIMNILDRLNRERGKTIVIVSHNMSIMAQYAKRLLVFHEGKVREDGPIVDVIQRLDEREDLRFLVPPAARLTYLSDQRSFRGGSMLKIDDLVQLRHDRRS